MMEQKKIVYQLLKIFFLLNSYISIMKLFFFVSIFFSYNYELNSNELPEEAEFFNNIARERFFLMRLKGLCLYF